MPYMRPPLSKEIWHRKNLPNDVENLSFQQWNGQERSLFYEPPEFYLDVEKLSEAPNGGVAVATGWIVSKVDPSTNTATLEDPKTGTEFTIQYDKCLIATGIRFLQKLPRID
jgi:apoptosis-inducing factor 1